MERTGNPTLILREEHRLIERAILVLAWMLNELQVGAVLDGRKMCDMAKIFRNYLERCHHVKEDFLLSMVRDCEGSVGRYPVQSFYDEHHRTQPILIALVKAAQEDTNHSGSDDEALVRSLCDVIDFYPGHIWKGDHLLLPLADELLREADKHVLIQQFKWIESTVGDDAAREFAAMVAEFPVELNTNLFSRQHLRWG